MSSIEGMDDVLGMLDGLEDELLLAAMKGLEKGLKRTVAEAKALCQVDTGGLRNSIQSHVSRQGDKIDGTVSATGEHAVYVEMGTGPVGEVNHAGISPNAKPTYSPKGWTYFHPKQKQFFYSRGQPARPYMYPAYKLTKRQIIEDVKAAINKRG